MLKRDMITKARLIFVGLIVLTAAVLAISCGDEKGSTTPEESPTPIVKNVTFEILGKGSRNVDIKSPFALAKVDGTMSSDLAINFGIRNPDHMVVNAYLNQTGTSFSFQTPLEGTYQFYFDNSQQEQSRKVTLTYTMYPQ